MPPRRSSGRLSGRGRSSTDNAESQQSDASPVALTNGRMTRSRRSVENQAAAAAAAVVDTEIPDAPPLEAKPSSRRTSNRGRKSKEAAGAAAMPPPPPPPSQPAPTTSDDSSAQILPPSTSTSLPDSVPLQLPHPTTTATTTVTASSLSSSSSTTLAATAGNGARPGRVKPAGLKYVRAPAMKNAFRKAVKACTKNVTYDNFASCFPTVARHQPQSLRDLHASFLNVFNTAIEENWDELNDQRQIFSHLDDIDRLIYEARQRKALALPNALPPGDTPIDKPPSALIAAHLVPLLEEQEAGLRVELEQRTESVEALRKQKEAQEKELAKLIRKLEGQAGVVAETAEAMKELGSLEELEREADKMDEGGGT